MAEYSENVAQAAAVLGTIFYQDPASEKGQTRGSLGSLLQARRLSS